MLTDMWSSVSLEARYSRYSIQVSGKNTAPQLEKGAENRRGGGVNVTNENVRKHNAEKSVHF